MEKTQKSTKKQEKALQNAAFWIKQSITWLRKLNKSNLWCNKEEYKLNLIISKNRVLISEKAH